MRGDLECISVAVWLFIGKLYWTVSREGGVSVGEDWGTERGDDIKKQIVYGLNDMQQVDIQRWKKLVRLLNDSIVGTVSSEELRINFQCCKLYSLLINFYHFVYIL
jgi:hypothetical protein